MKKVFKATLALFLIVCTMFSFTVSAEEIYGWQYNDVGWWWVDSDGTYPTNAWRKLGYNWYYFDSNGYWVDNNDYEKGSIKGIDVSKWQEEIDWQAVKDFGIEFAFVRLGYGNKNLDRFYEANMQKAQEVGIPAGVYYYSMALNEAEAVRDARFVIENLAGKLVSYPVAIDLEDSSQINLSKQELGKIAKAFCDEIRKAGYTPMLYCNENWYKNHIDVSLIPNVEKWIARYGGTYDDNIKRDIWQCTSKSRVDGIKGNVDIDFAFKDYSKIITPRRFADEDYFDTKGVWKQNEIGWWYSYYTGGYPRNAWELIDGEYFWFDSFGYMKTGWIWDGSNYYYADSLGHLCYGWLNVDGNWYYLNQKGAMLTGKQTIDGSLYYFKQSGAMATGWAKTGGSYYYADIYGRLKTGWLLWENKWYYLDQNGVMQTGWLKLNNDWYYLNSGGDMVTGTKFIDTRWYTFNIYGVWVG